MCPAMKPLLHVCNVSWNWLGAKGGGANLDLTGMQTQSKLRALEGHMKELQHIVGEEEGLSNAWLKPLKAVKGATEQLIKEKGGLMQKEAESELQTHSVEAQALPEKVQKWKQASLFCVGAESGGL